MKRYNECLLTPKPEGSGYQLGEFNSEPSEDFDELLDLMFDDFNSQRISAICVWPGAIGDIRGCTERGNEIKCLIHTSESKYYAILEFEVSEDDEI